MHWQHVGEGGRMLLRADVHVRVRMRLPELVRVSGYEEQVSARWRPSATLSVWCVVKRMLVRPQRTNEHHRAALLQPVKDRSR